MRKLFESKQTLIAAALCLLLIPSVQAQDAVPGEILQRTIMIKNGTKYGTAFKIDHHGQVYLVTARHMVEGLPKSKATIQVWHSNQWEDFQIVEILFPPSESVDIAVLETDEQITRPYDITTDDTGGGVTMGQQVWFLGYPYQIASQWKTGQIAPFIKRGTMSAIDGRDPDAVVIYVDGFNNPGFSGGPVVYWDFTKHAYGILAVVQGYKEDTAKVLVNGQHLDTQLLVNSGILIGYSIRHANQALEGRTEK
jgi:hypothetical protein